MQRNRRQLPDFRYVTVGEDTYYLPYYIKTFVLTSFVVVGMALPVIVLAIVAWSFMA